MGSNVTVVKNKLKIEQSVIRRGGTQHKLLRKKRNHCISIIYGFGWCLSNPPHQTLPLLRSQAKSATGSPAHTIKAIRSCTLVLR